ncbi:MAG: hypothetical protein M1815_005143 [Lichina confinis]|nr:MAG: hypothetical protein M1815_005143 [Lichina confinis]
MSETSSSSVRTTTSTGGPSSSATPSATEINSAQNTSSTTDATSTSTSRFLIPLPPGQTPPAVPTDREQRDGSLVNVYFLLIGIGVVLVVVVYYFYHKRRMRKSARAQDRGRNALARDVEGWVSQRRWLPGGRSTSASRTSRTEEGLNERGEAPPPYQRGSSPQAGSGSHSDSRGDSSADGTPIPLANLPARPAPALLATHDAPPKYDTLMANNRT